MDICSICHEPFDGVKPIVIAKHVSDRNLDESRKRGHYFHRSCLDEWKKHCGRDHNIAAGFICPMDRDEICQLHTVPNYELVKFDLMYYDSDMLRVLNVCRERFKGFNKHFLQQIKDIDEQDRKGKTLAYYVCFLGDYNIALKLLTAGADFNKHIGSHGFTPLMAAVCQNHSNIVNRLLSSRQVRQGCNTMDNFGMTAFMYACKGCFNRIITDFLVNEIPTAHQVRHCLVAFKVEFDADTLYGKEIIHKLNHYLKPK
jgi:hypothetical protein